jgi:hypothetical protein
MTAAPLLITPSGVAATAVDNLLAAAPPLNCTYSDPTAVLAAVIVATIRLLGDGMAGNANGSADALLDLALDYPAITTSEEPVSANCAAAAANSAAIIDLARLGALTAWCESLARRSYAGGSERGARTAVAERLGQELGHAAKATNIGLSVAVHDLQDAIVRYLTRLIADQALVVTATEMHSMPTPWWAWRLYADPDRTVDLAPGDDVRQASFVPLSFFALAPAFAMPEGIAGRAAGLRPAPANKEDQKSQALATAAGIVVSPRSTASSGLGR